MLILYAGLVTGLLARSMRQLLIVAGAWGFLAHALPRIIKSLRDIRAIRSASESDKDELRAAGFDVESAASLTPLYTITFHSVKAVVGCITVALAVMGVKSLFR